MASEGAERRLAAILSADAVGYTRLMSEDEAGTIQRLTAYRDLISNFVQDHHGRVVDSPGDNILAEFPNALDAVQCAAEVQSVLQVRNQSLAEQRRMLFRIGVHLGDVAVDGERIYGDGVNIAARLEGLAEPGGICISGVVHEQVEGKLALGFEDLGEQQVKNIARPVRVYRVREGRGLAATQPSRRGPLIAAAVVLVLALGGLLAWWTQQDAPRTNLALDDSLLALPTGPRVAVLPFTNLSGDPEQEFFSDGLTDNIITALSRFKDLFVIARNSTFRYKGKPVDVRELQDDLGARYVVEGSVQRAGDRLRVTTQLLDAKDGTHLWAETYDRDLSAADIFDVQDDIAGHVVGTIASVHGAISRTRFSEVKTKPTDRLDAYECVLRSRAYFEAINASEHGEIRECLERAVESDPGYAEAWVSLSSIYRHEYTQNFNPRPDSLGRALEAARRARTLDPASQTAHQALAAVYFFRHELDGFLAETQTAIALNPNNAATLAYLGALLMNMGDERGITLVRKAARLDPFHPSWFNLPITEYYLHRGEYDEALAAVRKVDSPGDFWVQVDLAIIYAELGRQREARSAVDELLRLYPGFTIEKYIDEHRKWNIPEEIIPLWAESLRKAGVPE